MANTHRERRQCKRYALSCPVRLAANGQPLATSRATNVSDGGLYVVVPIAHLPRGQAKLAVTLSLPRSTPNTFMFEDVQAEAEIIRQQPMKDDSMAGMALRFTQPLDLGIEV